LVKKVFVIPDRCMGCEECIEACAREHGGIALNYIVPVKKLYFMPIRCAHCADAPCLRVCPTDAIAMNEFGAIVIQKEKCIGCGFCLLVCPFGVPRTGPDGKMMKCELCSDKLRNGEIPACVESCPTDALVFEEDIEYGGRKRERIAQKLIEGSSAGSLIIRR